MKKYLRIVSTLAVVSLFLTAVLPATAGVTKSTVFYDGNEVLTIETTAPMFLGSDPYYRFFGAQAPAPGQLDIAGIGPGDPGFAGGAWKVHAVVWLIDTPYLLKSEADILAAQNLGHVRVPVFRPANQDFRGPILTNAPLP